MKAMPRGSGWRGNDGNLALRDVTIGRTNDGYAEIVISGLAAGEKIVTSWRPIHRSRSAGG